MYHVVGVESGVGRREAMWDGMGDYYTGTKGIVEDGGFLVWGFSADCCVLGGWAGGGFVMGEWVVGEVGGLVVVCCATGIPSGLYCVGRLLCMRLSFQSSFDHSIILRRIPIPLLAMAVLWMAKATGSLGAHQSVIDVISAKLHHSHTSTLLIHWHTHCVCFFPPPTPSYYLYSFLRCQLHCNKNTNSPCIPSLDEHPKLLSASRKPSSHLLNAKV